MITVQEFGPTFSTFNVTDPQHSTSGRILSLAMSADPNRIYAGSFAGVWRSDDSGHTFRQMLGPLTDSAGPGIFGGIYAPHVFDLAASPTDPDLVLAGARNGQFVTSRDGIYRSANGGQSWELVLQVPNPTSFTGVSQIEFAPDDPNLAYAAMGINGIAFSIDAGKTWTLQSIGILVWHIAVAPQEAPGVRRMYAAGISFSNVSQIFYSENGGASWKFDPGGNVINASRATLAAFQSSCGGNGVGGFAGRSASSGGSSPKILAVEPGNPAKVYLATPGGALGPSYYNNGPNPAPDGTQCNTVCNRLAGEGSIWYGDFSQFTANGQAFWLDMPGPPVYSGGGDTPSGCSYVITKLTSTGFLVFLSDTSHVHVSQGTPATFNSWHRLGGKDASRAKHDGTNFNNLTVHADPHALIFTPDFEITLQPSTEASPYDQNSELDQHISGTIWMGNDGGVCRSDDGGETWPRADGLETLDPVNIAGLFGIGNTPALYFGCGDNDDFFTRNGGGLWQDPRTGCGDCDAWFADEAQPSRILQFDPRHFINGVKVPGVNVIFSDDSSQYPDATDGSHTRFIPSTKRPKQPDGSVPAYPVSDVVLRGYRPLIRTLATEAPLDDGDYVFIHSSDGVSRQLLRTTSISSITQLSDWDDPSKASPIGPKLPPTAQDLEPFVQVSGGHFNPVFFVGEIQDTSNGVSLPNDGKVWRLDKNANVWKQIVPGGPPGRQAVKALSFFVDPYRPEIIYLVDSSGIKVSLDSGDSWLPELALAQAVTAGGKIIGPTATVMSDMLFCRGESSTRFAFGDAGVFCTINGFEWITLLDAIAVPGRPESGFFDPLSDPNDRSLYVELEGRSILRLGGIPGPPPFQPPPPFDLMEFAAIIEA
jgi:hypothetical protein